MSHREHRPGHDPLPQTSSHRDQTVGPGKRTLTMGLGSHQPAGSPPVQRRAVAAHAMPEESRAAEGPVEDWMAVALRPDLHQTPILRKSMDDIGYAGDASSPAAAGARDPGQTFAQATAGAGAPLPFRSQMEHAFGEDLSGVRVHTGERTAMTSLHAHAAAQGDTIAFASRTPDMSLVAHEVAHVVQQRHAGGGGVHAKSAVSAPDHASEREADAVASRVVAGERVQVSARPAAGIHLKVDEKEVAALTAQKKTEFTEFRRWFLGKYVGDDKQYQNAQQLYDQSELPWFEERLAEYNQPRALVEQMPTLSRHQLYQEMAKAVTDFQQYAVDRYEDRGSTLFSALAQLGTDYPQLLVDPGLMSPTHFQKFLAFVTEMRTALATFQPGQETTGESTAQAPSLVSELAAKGNPSAWDMRAAFSKKLGNVTVYRGLKLNEAAKQKITEQGMSPRVHRELDNDDAVMPPLGEMRDKSYFDVSRDRVSPPARKNDRVPPASGSVKSWERSKQQPARRAPVKTPARRPGTSKAAPGPSVTATSQPAETPRDRHMATFARDVTRMGAKDYDKHRNLVDRNNDREEAMQSVSRIPQVSVAVAADSKFSGTQQSDQTHYLVELSIPALDVIDPLDYRNEDARQRGYFPESLRLTSPEGQSQDMAYSSEVESLVMGTIAPEEVVGFTEWKGGQWTSGLDALRDEQDKAQQDLDRAESDKRLGPARVAERQQALEELQEKRALVASESKKLKDGPGATSSEGQEQVTTLEDELESLDRQIETAEEYLRQEREDLESAQRRIDEYQPKIAAIEKKRAALRAA